MARNSKESKLINAEIATCYEKSMGRVEIAAHLKKKKLKYEGIYLSEKGVSNRIYRMKNDGTLSKTTKGKTTMKQITVKGVTTQLGITQTELAKRLKVNPGSLVRWKKQGIPTDKISAFEKLLGKTTAPTTTKRAYTRRAKLNEIDPEDLPGYSGNDGVIFIIAKSPEVIDQLFSKLL